MPYSVVAHADLRFVVVVVGAVGRLELLRCVGDHLGEVFILFLAHVIESAVPPHNNAYVFGADSLVLSAVPSMTMLWQKDAS